MILIAVVNKDLPPHGFGGTMNALAHIILGAGHRTTGMPNINVYVGDTEQVCTFRALAVDSSSEQALYGDFPHTMSGADTDAQLALGRATPAEEMCYYAAFYMAEEIDARLINLIATRFERFTGYFPFSSTSCSESVAILPADPGDPELPPTVNKKIILLLNTKAEFGAVINAAIQACLLVGQQAGRHALRLLDVIDANDGVHPNISYHPFLVKCTKDVAVHVTIAESAEKNPDLLAYTLRTAAKPGDPERPLATVIFGDQSQVDALCTRDNTGLYRVKFPALNSSTATSSGCPVSPLRQARISGDPSRFASAAGAQSHTVAGGDVEVIISKTVPGCS